MSAPAGHNYMFHKLYGYMKVISLCRSNGLFGYEHRLHNSPQIEYKYKLREHRVISATLASDGEITIELFSAPSEMRMARRQKRFDLIFKHRKGAKADAKLDAIEKKIGLEDMFFFYGGADPFKSEDTSPKLPRGFSFKNVRVGFDAIAKQILEDLDGMIKLSNEKLSEDKTLFGFF